MHLQSITTVIALSASVLAAPAPADWTITKLDNVTVSSVSKRNIGGIKICTDVNWDGTCGYKVQPLSTCIHLDAPWWHSISSFGPDTGTVCNLYNDYNCQELIYAFIRYPGSGDLRVEGINDGIGSFECRIS